MNRDMNKIKATVELIEITVGLLGSAYFGGEGYNIFLAALIGIGLSFLIRLPFALYASSRLARKLGMKPSNYMIGLGLLLMP